MFNKFLQFDFKTKEVLIANTDIDILLVGKSSLMSQFEQSCFVKKFCFVCNMNLSDLWY